MRGRVYFWEERVLYVGPGLAAGIHAHHAVQVCLPLSGPVRLRSSPGARWGSYDGAVIPSDVPHERSLHLLKPGAPGASISLLITRWREHVALASSLGFASGSGVPRPSRDTS